VRPVPFDPRRAPEASPFVRRYAELIVESAQRKPILDVACGGARNSILLAHLGATIVGLDIDLTRAHQTLEDLTGSQLESARDRITLRRCDLIRDLWPFASDIGGIVNVHFLHLPLLRFFSQCLNPGAAVLLESEPAHGGNYLQLPQAGIVKMALGSELSFLEYRERPAGPPNCGAVTVKLIARKI
jgi:SAM-dependent methyltransferase